MAATTAAAADDAINPVDLFDIDSFNLDDFDLDLAADEFCDAYATFVADNKIGSNATAFPPGGWLAGSGIDGFTGSISSSEGSSSSPDPGVTDGPFAGEGSANMSTFVCNLERFLLDDDGDVFDVAAACTDGVERPEEELSVDDYFDDLLVAIADCGAVVDAAVGDAAAGNGDADEGSLDAREDDEPTSRKRARHKIRSTTMMACSWAELEVTRRHLARIHVLPKLWSSAAAPALRCM